MPVDYLSETFYEHVASELKARVDAGRFMHSENVAQMAMQLAKTYEVSKKKARLAGILHDWDKGYSNADIKQRAQQFSIEEPAIVQNCMPRVLHAKTAAYALAQTYPGLPEDVLQAISRHTAAAVAMSDLDMILYIADALEPSRDFDRLDEIRAKIGVVSLEELFFVTFTDIFASLIKQKKLINPITVEVWNYYALRERERTMKGPM